jgi:Ca-activated chloride channel homolog
MKRTVSRCLILAITTALAACSAPRDRIADAGFDQTKPLPHASDSAATAPADSNVAMARDEQFEVGRREPATLGSAVAPYRTSSALVLSSTNANRERIYVQGPAYQPPITEKYQHQGDNQVHFAREQRFSTFAIDVDTGSYANVRRFLNGGSLPPRDAVRVEELINYFDYAYDSPRTRSEPFRVTTELAPAPWNAQALLLRIGIKGFEVPRAQRPAANLVFLIDVSGSMQSPDKLPLLKSSLRLLAEQLTARDRVSMVVYAGNTGVVLEPTPGDQQARIQAAIDNLEAGGPTNGGDGIRHAYQLAQAARLADGTNRVVLATDGDFNVGTVDFAALIELIETQRATGVALTTLGFGAGNNNDQLLERLADAGNGNHAYVDTVAEARKVLVSDLSATLHTIAQDVKIQIEFNPAEVLEYRLIGYENRALAREDFDNDTVDGGEIGAGHRVTAFYEIIKVNEQGRLGAPRYATAAPTPRNDRRGELAHLRLRYQDPAGRDSELIELPIMAAATVPLNRATADFRFAASVAAFGQRLRGGKYLDGFDYAAIAALAKGSLMEDGNGYRREFLGLIERAQALTAAALPAAERVGEVRW